MTRETFLILLSLAAMVIAVVVTGFSMSTAAEGLTNKAACHMMMFGDQWELGYHNQTLQKCLFLQQ